MVLGQTAFYMCLNGRNLKIGKHSGINMFSFEQIALQSGWKLGWKLVKGWFAFVYILPNLVFVWNIQLVVIVYWLCYQTNTQSNINNRFDYFSWNRLKKVVEWRFYLLETSNKFFQNYFGSFQNFEIQII